MHPQTSRDALLVRIVTELAQQQLHWPRLAYHFSRTYYGRTGSYTDEMLPSLLGESHVSLSLEHICRQYRDRVVIDPVPEGASAGDYTFRYGRNRNLIAMTASGSEFAEYDEVLSIDGKPLVIEVKLARYRGRGKTRNLRSSGVHSSLSVRQISQFLDPVCTYFKSESDYAVMLYPEQINPTAMIQQRFVHAGGILIPFPKTREGYLEEVERMRVAFGI